MNADGLKEYLRRYQIAPNFTYGQNFLIDDLVLIDMVEAAGVTKGDAVLEIGPGIGNLTRMLCEHAGFVLSVEKDPKFYPILRSIKKDCKNFRFEVADALRYNFQDFFRSGSTDRNPDQRITTDLRHQQLSVDQDDISISGSGYKVVANIPYYITGKILQMLLNAKDKPTSITVLTQKEVAQNVTAKTGDLSVLAISVQLYGDPKIVKIVPARSFYPAPKVDSAILHIDLHSKPKYEIGDEKKFFSLLKACFAGKRKQIHNTLKNNLRMTEEEVKRVLGATGIRPEARPQELSIDDWVRLSQNLKI